MVEETFDVEFDETNGSQGASDNLDDVGDEPFREAMKNIQWETSSPKRMMMRCKSSMTHPPRMFHKMMTRT